MHQPDLEKLRRFALTIALITITYATAGISLEQNSNISLIGLTFKVSRPSLLPIGLALASFYAMISFFYYGFMLKKSPYRTRRDTLNSLTCYERRRFKNKVSVYFGPTKFSASLWVPQKKETEEYIKNFPEVFPKFALAQVNMNIESSESFNEDGESNGMDYNVEIVIPIRCRMAAIFQDIDYALPVWLNFISLTIFLYRIGVKGIYA